jgi:hypothetical protein
MTILDSNQYKEAERQNWNGIAPLGKSGGKQSKEVLKKLVNG